jgi:hypothetical protein
MILKSPIKGAYKNKDQSLKAWTSKLIILNMFHCALDRFALQSELNSPIYIWFAWWNHNIYIIAFFLWIFICLFGLWMEQVVDLASSQVWLFEDDPASLFQKANNTWDPCMHGSHTLIVLVVLGLIDAVMELGQTMIQLDLKERMWLSSSKPLMRIEALSNQVLFVNWLQLPWNNVYVKWIHVVKINLVFYWYFKPAIMHANILNVCSTHK